LNRYYRAPWGKELRNTTALILTIVVLGMVIVQGLGLFLLAAALIASYLFFIRGYSIQNGSLIIHGLLWSRAFSLVELQGAQVKPFVLNESKRQSLVDGLFSYFGAYRSPSLGNIMSFATHYANTVVLDFDGQVIVISPEDPESFEKDVLMEYRRLRRM
jgi:hypothetical protein